MIVAEHLLHELPAIVSEHWGKRSQCTPLSGGMNSITATVDTAEGRFVAKWVSGVARDELLRGAEAALMMSNAGIRAGAPLPTDAGALSVSVLDGELVLLEYVPGIPLTAAAANQRAWGATLAAIHNAALSQPSVDCLDWIPDDAEDPAYEGWVIDAAQSIRDEVSALPPLSYARLHTDPAPEAFLRDAAGRIGVVDWTGSRPGPVLYDVASAVMYAGGREAASTFLQSYQQTGPLPESELREYLSTFSRLRAVVQAVYFSQRIRSGNLQGIKDDRDNVIGLRDARRMLHQLARR